MSQPMEAIWNHLLTAIVSGMRDVIASVVVAVALDEFETQRGTAAAVAGERRHTDNMRTASVVTS